MTTFACWRAFLLAAATLLAAPAFAQAPGEDPVLLKGRVALQMQPTGPAPKSGNIDNATDMPAWLRARVARYEARAFATDAKGILTDNDVVTTSAAQGLRKTCVQEVGSTTAAPATPGTQYGPGRNQQVVVLRGDLVNICN